MNALLIDDERLARNELRRLLAKHPEVAVIGEAANADEARARVAGLRPDLLFLDIQMPGDDGLSRSSRPCRRSSSPPPTTSSRSRPSSSMRSTTC
jgi:two-component system LytT family response regulator